MAQQKTPGVYVVEKDAFPNSVVEVPSGVPVFLGYTETARRGDADLTGQPVRITSLPEFHQYFGGPAKELFAWDADELSGAAPRRYLYPALRMFFANGGGACWIVSLGGYEAAPQAADYTDAIWEAVQAEAEPAVMVAPDAVALGFDGHMAVSKRMLSECAASQSRFAILDLHGGAGPDLPSAISEFRSAIPSLQGLGYGAVYGPWLNTLAFAPSEVDLFWLDHASRVRLKEAITGALSASDAELMRPWLETLATQTPEPDAANQAHTALMNLSTTFQLVMSELLEAVNLLPPSGAMAGIYAKTDDTAGVWSAPANVALSAVASPAVVISNDDQEEMNLPLDGLAVNAIRNFPGRGVLVWGARTLDGNSQDWRYINTRRTMIMLEQSIKCAAQAYVFAANDASTWRIVKMMLENFLHNQWKAGALAGVKPADAYDVSVGLGSTMTGQDILDGYMRITTRVAVARPAEFIVITFQQKMQTS